MPTVLLKQGQSKKQNRFWVEINDPDAHETRDLDAKERVLIGNSALMFYTHLHWGSEESSVRNWIDLINKNKGYRSFLNNSDIPQFAVTEDNYRILSSQLKEGLEKRYRIALSYPLAQKALESSRLINDVCSQYIEEIKTIEIVKKVLIINNNNVLTFWTLIDTPAFEDSLRDPLYRAQLSILSSSPDEIRIDFRVLNISEFSGEQNLSKSIPANANLIWER